MQHKHTRCPTWDEWSGSISRIRNTARTNANLSYCFAWKAPWYFSGFYYASLWIPLVNQTIIDGRDCLSWMRVSCWATITISHSGQLCPWPQVANTSEVTFWDNELALRDCSESHNLKPLALNLQVLLSYALRLAGHGFRTIDTLMALSTAFIPETTIQLFGQMRI